ncbi:hypothetical protein ACSSS7_005015 [Eimeria intestinalis]
MNGGEAPHLEGKDLISTSKCFTLHNGVQMPILGLGTWRLNGDKLRSGVYGALKEGYGLIDSATLYHNEWEIRDLLRRAGNPKVWLSTKLSPEDANGKDAVIEAFEGSRRNLGVEQIDLYLIHWPASGKLFTVAPDSKEKRFESWSALEQLYEEGKASARADVLEVDTWRDVRTIGVSNFLVSHLEELLQLEWHPMCWVPEMIPFAKKHNIALQAYSSLGSGQNRLVDHPVVKEIAKEINQPPAVVLLRWPLQQGLMVIPCSTSRAHLRENKAALECELSENQMNRLCSIKDSTQYRFCWDPNTVP